MWAPLLVVVRGIFVRSGFMVGANRRGTQLTQARETPGTIWAQDKVRVRKCKAEKNAKQI